MSENYTVDEYIEEPYNPPYYADEVLISTIYMALVGGFQSAM
jgi:hypothetical protein